MRTSFNVLVLTLFALASPGIATAVSSVSIEAKGTFTDVPDEVSGQFQIGDPVSMSVEIESRLIVSGGSGILATLFPASFYNISVTAFSLNTAAISTTAAGGHFRRFNNALGGWEGFSVTATRSRHLSAPPVGGHELGQVRLHLLDSDGSALESNLSLLKPVNPEDFDVREITLLFTPVGSYASHFTATASVDSLTWTPQPIPEPDSLALFVIGAGIVLLVVRRSTHSPT